MEDVYNSLRILPMMESKISLYGELQRVNDYLTSNPGCQSLNNAVAFLFYKKIEILRVFGACAWSYVCAPSLNQEWDECVATMQSMLQGLTADCQSGVTNAWSWGVALKAWSKFVFAIKAGCIGNGQRGGPKYVIRRTPGNEPFNGRVICMPTLTPDRVTERNYGSIGECKMALAQLPPQLPPNQNHIPYYAELFCNEYGCFTEPQWHTLC